MLFFKARPRARFASWSFLALLVLFASISTQRLAVGLTGIGAVLIISSILVEANKERIWDDYKKQYKYSKNDLLPKSWSEPNQLYYRLNIYLVWPTVFLLGLAAIYAAYLIA